MSSLLKYFALVCLLIICLSAFFVVRHLDRFVVQTSVLNTIASEHLKIANYYSKQIWCRFNNSFASLSGNDIPSWKQDPNFQRLTQLSDTLLNASGADKVSLYTASGTEFFSTLATDVVYFDQNQALGLTQTGTHFIQDLGIYRPSGELRKGSYIRTYVQLDDAACPNPLASSSNHIPYIAIFTDVSASLTHITLIKIYLISGITLLLIVFYLALYLTTKKTERIINKQHEEKLSLEALKSQAESQNQEKSMFLANVSHELRTPLNAIIGFSEIIKDEVMGPVGHRQYAEYITDINSSGIHLLSLINDILDYSKAEARKLEVESVDVDLTKIAHSCMRLVEPRAQESKVKLIENLTEHHVVLSADPKRMKQIILNLLSNAVKFTPENGQVTLTIREDLLDEKVQLTVADTGIGIAPKDLSKAMAPFGQIDSSLSRRYEGTGLGLPLTKKLTDIMGGSFDIKSEVGVGTTVTLTFPLKKQNKEKLGKDHF